MNLPDHIETIAYLPLGYPAVSADDKSRHHRRKSIDEIVSYDRY
jgi:hypothetical protein